MDVDVRGSRTEEVFIIFIGTSLSVGAAFYFYFIKSNHLIAALFLLAALIVPLIFLVSGGSQPSVVSINEEGIYDRRLGIGVIHWGDIESAQVEANYGNRYICLRVKSVDRYVSKLPAQQRQKVEDAHDLGFKLINIDVQGLNISLLDLLKHIEKKRASIR